MPVIPRLHLFELDDQPWVPAFVRQRVQAFLTLAWTIRLPFIQKLSAAELAAETLLRTLKQRVHEYTFVDFCSGAGGPTPTIEKFANAHLTQSHAAATGHPTSVRFLLSDLHPHLSAWKALSSKSEHLSYISEPVNAAKAPLDLIERQKSSPKVFRLFSLSFHHFDDVQARKIMVDTLQTADGIGIFELQDRPLTTIIAVTISVLFMNLIAPILLYNDPMHLLLTWIVPVVPIVLLFDGWVSCVRVRTLDETLQLVKSHPDLQQWDFRAGRQWHTWPLGELISIIGVKR